MAQDDTGATGQTLECQSCPLCAGLAALREARPEAVDHLVRAGAELLLAAKALLDGAGEAARGPVPRRRRARPVGSGDHAGTGLQHIDVG
jgi:hypothetical protein